MPRPPKKRDPQDECVKRGHHTWVRYGYGCKCVVCGVLD
jgi:hypothetical protein